MFLFNNECECRFNFQKDIVIAQELDMFKAISDAVKTSPKDIVVCHVWKSQGIFGISSRLLWIDGYWQTPYNESENFKIAISLSDFLKKFPMHKKACLTCGTCIPAHNQEDLSKFLIKEIEDEFQRNASKRASEKLNKEREKMAKDICGLGGDDDNKM